MFIGALFCLFVVSAYAAETDSVSSDDLRFHEKRVLELLAEQPVNESRLRAVLLSLAEIRDKCGNREESLDFYRQVLELAPVGGASFRQAQNDLGRACLARGSCLADLEDAPHPVIAELARAYVSQTFSACRFRWQTHNLGNQEKQTPDIQTALENFRVPVARTSRLATDNTALKLDITGAVRGTTVYSRQLAVTPALPRSLPEIREETSPRFRVTGLTLGEIRPAMLVPPDLPKEPAVRSSPLRIAATAQINPVESRAVSRFFSRSLAHIPALSAGLNQAGDTPSPRFLASRLNGTARPNLPVPADNIALPRMQATLPTAPKFAGEPVSPAAVTCRGTSVRLAGAPPVIMQLAEVTAPECPGRGIRETVAARSFRLSNAGLDAACLPEANRLRPGFCLRPVEHRRAEEMSDAALASSSSRAFFQHPATGLAGQKHSTTRQLLGVYVSLIQDWEVFGHDVAPERDIAFLHGLLREPCQAEDVDAVVKHLLFSTLILREDKPETYTGVLDNALAAAHPANKGWLVLALAQAAQKAGHKQIVAQMLKTLDGGGIQAGTKLRRGALMLAAMAHFQNGKLEEGREVLQALIEKYPDADSLDRAQFLLAWSFLTAGDKREALNRFELFIAQYPQSQYADRARDFIQRLQPFVHAEEEVTF
jgi:tetratricopeptide (TPR) repeat protein